MVDYMIDLVPDCGLTFECLNLLTDVFAWPSYTLVNLVAVWP